MADERANNEFDGNDPFLTHTAGVNVVPPTREGKKHVGGASKSSFLTQCCATFGLIVAPWLLFVALLCCFTFLYHHWTLLVWSAVLLSAFVCLAFIMFARKKRSRIHILFFGVLCGIATAVASVLGMYNYYSHMFFFWSYLDNGVYTNLLPSEPAEAHADAGKLFFSDNSHVDTTKAAGYKDGSVYCVAPILDDVPIAKVQYYAVGVDCCSARADFNCDDAWNPQAKSAVVVLESNNWFPSLRDKYMEAVELCQSTYDIFSSANPVFVRWVAEPEVIQDDYWRSGIGFLVAAVCIYLLVSIIFGLISDQSVKRSKG